MATTGVVLGLGIFYLFVSQTACQLNDYEDLPQGTRSSRWFPFLWNAFGGGSNCASRCPPHHCRFSDAVIHGFCCGCAKPGDRVPIQCPLDIRCPLHPQPLCGDYDFMMDCCC